MQKSLVVSFGGNEIGMVYGKRRFTGTEKINELWRGVRVII
jgi:hypothetical protein